MSQPPHLEKAFTMALFGDRYQEYLKDADETIKSLGQQDRQDFTVDIAVDRLEALTGLTESFQKHARHIVEEGRLVFTPLPLGVDNKAAANIRFGNYLKNKEDQVRVLFAADLDDIFPPDYNRKMTTTIDGGADVAIANQIAFPIGTDWRKGQSIQHPRFERGHKFDLSQILHFNMAGFCNTAINLQSDVFQKYVPQILYAIAHGTNKQLDRNGIGVAFAYGAYGELSEADMGYGQGNGFYGQNGTSLASEVNMQYLFTKQLVGLNGLPFQARQLITAKHDIDKELLHISQKEAILWGTYKMLANEGGQSRKEQGHHEQWGEQVIPRTREEIRAAVPYYYEVQRQLG